MAEDLVLEAAKREYTEMLKCYRNCKKANRNNPVAASESIRELLEACKRFLESSACRNDCDPDDMTCDTNFARRAVAKAEQ